MSGRLATHLLVAALLRRASDAGGLGAVLARGDAEAGVVLIIAEAPGSPPRVFERGIGADGRAVLIDSTPADDVDDYWRRRRARDPDLWVIGLDVAAPQRLAAEVLLGD